jgi:hypothetical protein
MNNPHEYFLQHIYKLDNNFKSKVMDEPLYEYIQSLKSSDFIETPSVSLVIQSCNDTYQKTLVKPVNEILNEKYLIQFIDDPKSESRFIISFSQESDYSSHIRIVGTITPVYTYQILIEEFSEFESNYLFILQLMLLTYWEVSLNGTHPWVSIIER